MKSIIARTNMGGYKSIIAIFRDLTKRNITSITNLTYATVSNIRAIVSKIIRPATNTAIATTSCAAQLRKKRTLAYFNSKTFADLNNKTMQEVVYEIIS